MEKQLTVKEIFSSDSFRSRVEELFGEKEKDQKPKTTAFIISAINAVNQNKLLSQATPQSLLTAVITSATMQLPINENLGFAYIVPFKTKSETLAQLQIGWKGFVQLAERSGQFRTISASPIYENQIVSRDKLKGYKFDFEKDPEGEIAGYAGYFQLLNGFEKTLFMSSKELNQHAKKYSQTFKRGFGVWKDNFDAMAMKTVLKLLLSKFAPLSIEMQTAIMEDQKANDQYVDNLRPKLEDARKKEERKRVLGFIEQTQNTQEMEEIKEVVYTTEDEFLIAQFDDKYQGLETD